MGQTISLLGSRVTTLALPLTAVLLLGVTPAQMGVLRAAEAVPSLLVGLLAGVWVDRLRRRPVLLATDLGRAVLLGSIPVAAALGVLRVEHLYAVAFLAGLLTVFFEVAQGAFIPALVGRAHLVEANSKLMLSRSVVQIAGPGLAGILVQAITAPLTVAVDAASFLLAAFATALIRTPEPAPGVAPPGPRPAPPRLAGGSTPRRDAWGELWRDAGEGLRLTLGDSLLRVVTGSFATLQFFFSIQNTVYLLYVTRELGVQPATLGVIIALGSGGAILGGALVAGRVTRHFGLGPTLVGTALVMAAGGLLLPVTRLLPVAAVPLLVAAEVLVGLGFPIYSIGIGSLRQAVTPDRLQGRVTATYRFVVWGAVAGGVVIGGLLGEVIGLWPALGVAVLGRGCAVLWLVLSPVRTLRIAPPTEPSPVAAL